MLEEAASVLDVGRKHCLIDANVTLTVTDQGGTA